MAQLRLRRDEFVARSIATLVLVPPRGSLTERVKTPELIKRPFRSDGGERAEREIGALPSKSV